MATPYTAIYERALFKIKDSKLATLNMTDQEFVLKKYLQSAVADFENHCQFDLNDVDEEQECFNEDLSNEVQEILALGISVYWLNAQILDKELLRNKLSTKDYTYFSPANLLREMNDMRSEYRKEYEHRLIDYTYDHGDLDMSERS